MSGLAMTQNSIIMKLNLVWAARIVAAVIMFQTLFFKFTAAPESVYIFSKIGVDPIGRIGTGVLELIASMLLLNARSSWFGAMMGAGLMFGAILTHVFLIGISVLGDGGKLFALAIITMLCCGFLIYDEKEKIIFFVKTKLLNF
jgi:hypothetical protein